MNEPKGYRGVEFWLLNLGDGKSKWSIYPTTGGAQARTGVVEGGAEEAEAACRKAIDAGLDRENAIEDAST